MLTVTKECTVAEIVTENIKTADVFKKFGIDFCCGGGISIAKVCEKKGIDFKVLENELSNVDKHKTQAQNYDKWSLSFLIDHIINIHHTYVSDNILVIYQYANKVAKVHGHHYTEVIEINDLFLEVANELTAHMQKEEQILFPYIKELVAAETEGKTLEIPHFGSVKNPIQMMEMEHENAGDIFKKIAQLTNNYTPPLEACNTFKALYSKLQEFEEDLHQHIHLENNILHPKAKKLEVIVNK
ncbi:iron-sulfur cluster repair di-iron protein [Bacteroidota bacterium]